MTKLADAFVAVTADFTDLLSTVRDAATQAGDALDTALTGAGTSGGQGAASAIQDALGGLTVDAEGITSGVADAGAAGAAQAAAAVGEQLGQAGADAAGEIGAALAGAGATAGPQLADDVTNALSGVGADVGGQVASGLESGAQTGGEAAATGLGATFGAAGEKAGELFGEQFGAVAGTLIAAVGIKDLLGGGLTELEATQSAAAQTTVRLQDMGDAAGVTAEHVREMSEQLSKVTGISPAAVQSAENFLLTLGNIRNEVGQGNDIFDRAIRDAQDLAVAYGIDLGSAAQKLGRLLDDPIQNMQTLSRVGVKFSQDQQAVIKSMVDTGDALGAQRLILDEVEKRVRGSADAYGGTLAAQVDKAKLSFDELGSSILGLVLPVLEPLASGAADAAGALKSMISFLGDHTEVVVLAGAALAAAFAPAIIESIAATAAAVVLKFGQIVVAAQGLWATLAANPLIAVAGVAIAALTFGLSKLKDAEDAAGAAAVDAANKLTPPVDPSKIESVTLAVGQMNSEINTALDTLHSKGWDDSRMHGYLTQSASDFKDSKRVLDALDPSVYTLIGNVRKLREQEQQLTETVNGVAAAYKITPDAAYSMLKSLGELDKPLSQVLTDLKNQPGAVAGFIAGLHQAAGAGDSFATRAAGWSKAVTDFQDAQVGYAKAVGDALAGTRSQLGIFDAIKDKAQVTAQSILASIQTMALAAVQESANLRTLVEAGAPTALLQQLVQQGPEYVAAVANASNGVRKQIFDSFGAYLDDTAGLTKTKIGAGIEDGVTAAQAKVNQARAAVAAAFNALFAGPLSIVKSFVGNFVTSLAPLPGAGGKAASDTVTVIQGQLQRMPGTAEQLGLETGTSLSRGLAQGTAAVGQVVADLNAQLNGITHTIPVDIVIRRIDAGSATGTGGLKTDERTMAFGGPVLGGSGVRDDVPILGMGGEWMLTKADVASLGGFTGVQSMLNDLRSGHRAASTLHAPPEPTVTPDAGLGPVIQALQEQTRRLEHALIRNAQLTSDGVGGAIDGAAGAARLRYKNGVPRGN